MKMEKEPYYPLYMVRTSHSLQVRLIIAILVGVILGYFGSKELKRIENERGAKGTIQKP
jgi:hypothetical protein